MLVEYSTGLVGRFSMQYLPDHLCLQDGEVAVLRAAEVVDGVSDGQASTSVTACVWFRL